MRVIRDVRSSFAWGHDEERSIEETLDFIVDVLAHNDRDHEGV